MNAAIGGDAVQIRFFETSTRARIAYTSMGRGAPLILIPPWASHLEVLWEIPGHRRLCERLAQQHTVIAYDRWGCGLSDRARTDMTIQGDLDVLTDLITHLRLRRVALYGPSHGGQVALSFCETHPRLVSHLILFGVALRSRARNPAWTALRQLMLADWPLATSALAAIFLPGADRDEQDTFAQLFQAAATAETAVALLDATGGRDVAEIAHTITAPALVASRRGDTFTPPETTRELAAALPHSELVLLDGGAHVHYLGDVDTFTDTILTFLRRGRHTPDEPAGPAATLTAREREILDLLADGLTNAAIARQLVISVRTVERHTLNLYTKLGVRGRTEAIAQHHHTP
jgi:pimeloyl-ACP methyl ester carboxylesterase/DNA-binding CsgD family transcriptional regulator